MSVLLPAGVELAIISARTVKHEDRPPLPSEVVSIFIVFGLASLLGQWDRRVGSLFGWGIVVATLITDSSFLTPTSATRSQRVSGRTKGIIGRGETGSSPNNPPVVYKPPN